MKRVKHLLLAVLLASVLAVSVPAGEVDGPGFAGPTPTPTPEGIRSASNADAGDSNAAIITAETSDYLYYEVWAALLSVY